MLNQVEENVDIKIWDRIFLEKYTVIIANNQQYFFRCNKNFYDVFLNYKNKIFVFIKKFLIIIRKL